MLVYGYDANKKVEANHFSLQTVAEHGIHPWRVDLFDPRPIQLRVGGKVLSYSRLNDISFAYLVNHPVRCRNSKSIDPWTAGYFGMVSGGINSCCEGTVSDKTVASLGKSSNTHPVLIDLSDASFATAWWRYLRLASAGESAARQIYPIGDGQNIILRQGKVEYVSPKSLHSNSPQFAGEMFAEVRLRIELPRSINRLFSLLKDWSPVVYGGALRDVLCGGTSPRDINFMVDALLVSTIKKRLQDQDINATDVFSFKEPSSNRVVFEFQLDDVSYKMIPRGNILADKFWQVNDFSVNQVMATQPDEIIASRICLWDIGHRQARYIATHSPSEEELKSRAFSYKYERTAFLRKRGYRLLPDPF